ncbi:MAG: membrane protein insertion efficiency factor YidD [Clostridia bacterium]|nr:membrane protein insertion efficiency factor YidD [Clostridia bacterium]
MRRLFIGLVRFYQKHISPYKPRCCRFSPSCSAYAIEAFQRHGAFKGLLLALYRILRCNPFNKHCGHDPVPEEFSLFKRRRG